MGVYLCIIRLERLWKLVYRFTLPNRNDMPCLGDLKASGEQR